MAAAPSSPSTTTTASSPAPPPSPSSPFRGLALVAALASRAHGARVLAASPGLRAPLLRRLARLALPPAADRACVTISLGETLVVAYPVRADTPWLGGSGGGGGSVDSDDGDGDRDENGAGADSEADSGLSSGSDGGDSDGDVSGGFGASPLAASAASTAAAAAAFASDATLVRFTVAFVADRRAPEAPLRRAARGLNEALLQHEQLARFVSRGVAQLLAERAAEDAAAEAEAGAGGAGARDDGGAADADAAVAHAHAHAYAASSAAAAGAAAASTPIVLRDLLMRAALGLRSSGTAHLELPGLVPLSLSVSGGVWDWSAETPLRPYHALLLLREVGEVLALLPAAASPQLRAVARRAEPTRSIQELAAEAGLPAAQALRLAGHLVHHGLAAIVDTVSEESRYSLTAAAVPSAQDMADFARVLAAAATAAAATAATSTSTAGAGASGDVGATWSGGGGGGSSAQASALALAAAATGGRGAEPDLGAFLALLSRAAADGRALRAIMGEEVLALQQPQQRAVFVQAVVWLLRRRFLRQQHTLLLLLWPWASAPPPRSAAAAEAARAAEEARAAQLALSKPPAVQGLFRRLLAHLRSAVAAAAARRRAREEGGGGGKVGGGTEGGEAGDTGEVDEDEDEDEDDDSTDCRAEELMFRLRVSRSDLLSVAGLFPEVFVVLNA